MPQPRLNLQSVSVLVADRNHYSRALISQALRGFGVKHIIPCDSAAAAQEQLTQAGADLCLIEAELPDMSGADLVRAIRRLPTAPLRFVPVLMVSGYTQFRTLNTSRDAGANLILQKPISPQALFDRVFWLSKTKRAYIETADYIGPDRRFREGTPPDGAYKRSTDKTADAGAAADASAQKAST